MHANIILVANRLPFSIQQGPTGLVCQPSPGGMAAALGPIRDHYHAKWVGWAGLDRALTATERRRLALPAYAHAVDIPSVTYHNYYHKVANGSLWPILHGMKPRRLYSKTDWQSNLAVNQQFAERIATLVKKDDVIWVHDFHLIMLPALLRKMGVTNRIGFFLHVPVADAHKLTLLPHWPDMLRSLAQTDVCGVQTNRDVQNLRQSFADHNITAPRIANFPVGIDYSFFNESTKRAAVRAFSGDVNAETKDKTVILSVSRLDYTKGIVHQLQAVDALVAANPAHRILYKLIVAPSREALTEYRDVKNAVDVLVRRINRRRAGTVAYEYRTHEIDEISAWYNRADIMLVTPVIDGMNLVAKEYVAARQAPGVLVLSKNAGAAEQLKDALQVDPTDVTTTISALSQALHMPAVERARRHAAMRQNVMQEDVFAWADTFMSALQNA